MEMKKNILITGGFGFIGAHCIEKYYKDERDIYERYKDFMKMNNIDFVIPLHRYHYLFIYIYLVDI